MERLTVKGFNYNDAAIVENMRMVTVSAAMNRLAAYEDTGLEPETLSEILDSVSEWYDAHKEGRLLVLPCKVGDTVYTIIDGKIYEGEVYHISYSDYYGKVTSAVRAKIDFLTASIGAAFEDFGKTAFFTRAAAEAALKEREGK